MRRMFFYLNYAATNLRNSGHWTAFAIFCVAAGVATVVALRSLGLAITDSLLSNLRQYNHGDINITSIPNFGPFTATFQRGSDERAVFQDANIERVRQWVEQRGGQIATYAVASNIQIAPLSQSGQAERPQFTSSFLIDPETFALATPIVALDPVGVPLQQLFTGGREIVVSKNLADSLGLQVGDSVRVSGTEEAFIVRGIIPTETEASVNNILAAFFGFAYFHVNQAATLQLNAQANSIGIILADGTTEDQIIQAATDLGQLIPYRDMNTTPWLLRRNEFISDMISRFIVTMGLGAMLIGGVGIMNTMLVLVGRRSMEIASLKTFGLKGRQIGLLFISEAFLLGLMGSVVGVIVGVLLSGVVNGFGEAFLQQRLTWRVYPEAVVYGMGLGMVVTMVFGVLPVLMAAKIRPAIVLRPNETHIPGASLIQGFIALVVVVLVLGLIAGQIIGPALDEVTRINLPPPAVLGILAVSITMVILGLLTGVMWLVVWFVGHLPAFGSMDLRLALRNLSTRRMRTATTLLALTAGMFALSSITYFGMGAREIVRIQFSQTLGGNVMIVPLLPKEAAQPVINYALSFQDGVEYNTILNFNTGRILESNDQTIEVDGEQKTIPVSVLTRDTNNPTLTSGPVLAGRDLTEEDRGKAVIVLSEQSALSSLLSGIDSLETVGIGVGSKILIQVRGSRLEYEVIGIVGNINRFTPNIASAYVPPGAPGMDSTFQINVVQVAPENLNQFLINMQTLPLVFTVDVAFIDGLLKRLVDQMSAIPMVVGLLSLLAAAVIMANTVSLTILERRRQIGVLKALGLKRRRVLWVVLLENTIIGLLGGLLGIGVSSLGVSVMTLLGAGSAIPVPTDARWITVGLLVASVVIAWIATLLSARVAVDENVSKILRYE